MSSPRTAVIIGAGPAGLTAAFELLSRSDIKPLVFEAGTQVGGISRTVNYRGNRMDIGGHRFFSKSDWVMAWWAQFLPAQKADEPRRTLAMLLRDRLSRIYYERKFFDYPVKLNQRTITQLGPVKMARIGLSYAKASVHKRLPERSLADFFTNRFGGELYRTFFKSYTEKVWGVPCEDISPEWGAQRVKGLSIRKALLHAATSVWKRASDDVSQKSTSTSLIERFLYPRLGPGQLWEEVERQVRARGGEVFLQHTVVSVEVRDGQVRSVTVRDLTTGAERTVPCDLCISTMPVKDLVAGITPPAPAEVRRVAGALPYRDFITVGLLLKRMRQVPGDQVAANGAPRDNWIYIQEPDVKLGRLQVFNNWSPELVAREGEVWLGLEYFCQEGDELWRKSDEAMSTFAAQELEKIGLIARADVLDAHVVRVPKAYPAYFGTYGEFDRVREYTDTIGNLFLVGRNGMHRYNNQDHSMLTARLAVDAILAGTTDKAPLWAVNLDDEYHEEKKA
jgi:protoporphyrinogen oxidase